MNELAVSDGAVTGGVRVWLRVEGLIAFAVSVLLYAHLKGVWWIFIALLLTPDLAMLFYFISPKLGAFAYNLVHSYALPLGFVIVAIALGRTGTLPYLLIWTAHIGMDRCFGYGLKYPAGFGSTHLGVIGKRALNPSK